MQNVAPEGDVTEMMQYRIACDLKTSAELATLLTPEQWDPVFIEWLESAADTLAKVVQEIKRCR